MELSMSRQGSETKYTTDRVINYLKDQEDIKKKTVMGGMKTNQIILVMWGVREKNPGLGEEGV